MRTNLVNDPMNCPALFLDRDGVINVDYGYVHTPENFHFIDGIFDLVSAANRLGYLVIVVTNQSGIGRGYYSEAQFHALTEWMKSKFTERGGQIDGVYFCPFHPEFGIAQYRRETELRKPGPGMFLQAESELGINLAQSILVGDQITDIVAGRAAGIRKLLHLFGKKQDVDTIVITHLSQALPYLEQS